jgi:hypothetical protein
MYKKITKITLIMFMLSSCSNTVDSFKKGLTGAKNNSADEFLIKKKDPLILPPDFENLPTPGNKSTVEIEDETSIFKNTVEIATETDTGSSSAEDSILKKIQSK